MSIARFARGVVGLGLGIGATAWGCRHEADREGGGEAIAPSVTGPGAIAAGDHAGGEAVADARALVAAIQARFRVTQAPAARLRPPRLGRPAAGARAALGPSAVERFEREGAWLRPHLPAAAGRGVVHAARVALPARADGPFEIRDVDSGASLAVRLLGARDVEGLVADGYVVYPAAHASGADVVHRPTAAGTEDWLLFERAPAGLAVEYEVTLGRGVSGVRVAGGLVEALDASGTPRLRMASPYVVDARGAKRRAEVRVRGCDHDRDPRGPWGRPVTPPGAAACVIRIELPPVEGPLLLDPAWTTTGAPPVGFGCPAHDAVVLKGGKVLVVEGEAALFDRTTSTWTLTGQNAGGRCGGTLTRLADGRAFATGSLDGLNPTAEIYDPASGTWADTAPPPYRRAAAPATLLPSGKVLVTGGWDADSAYYDSATLFDPVTEAWAPAGKLSTPRFFHAQHLLATGKVLVAGGGDDSAELYDPAKGTWASTGVLGAARISAASAVLADGGVLLVGGEDSGLGFATGEVYDPGTGAWKATGTLAGDRSDFTANLLGTGQVLLAGGVQSTPADKLFASADLYTPATNDFLAQASMAQARYDHTSVRLPTGEVLIVGGDDNNSMEPALGAELFGLVAGNAACSVPGECVSGFCVDGVCCDAPCDAGCVACSAAKKGTGVDGQCGPVAAGLDPGADCLDSGSPACALNGACDGKGACQSYPVASGCAPAACAGATDCASGYCADGVCCDAACDGPCKACTVARKGSGLDGVCGAVAADTDPKDGCAPAPGFPASCKADGLCDGQGACRALAIAGTPCGTVSCAAAALASSACDGSGTCAASSVPCAPYACADGATCGTSCVDDADCAGDGYYCKGAVCAAKQPNGSPCDDGRTCDSGSCADGVCCNTACAGQCEACDVGKYAGTCSPVLDAPRGSRPPCPVAAAGQPCSGATCNGKNVATCTFPTNVVCREAACADGISTFSAFCDGAGACQEEQTKACAPYGCDAETTACKSTCSTDDDCAAGGTCDRSSHACVTGPTCFDDHTVKSPSGVAVECAPFRCEGTKCKASCASVDDCVAPNVCDAQHQCVAAGGTAAGDDGGCAVGPADGGTFPWSTAAAGAIGLLVTRRRRRAATARGLEAARGAEVNQPRAP